MLDIQRIGDTTDILGEGVIWSIKEGTLYWVDILGRLVWRYNPRLEEIKNWSMPELVGSIALCEQGELLVALQSAVFRFDIASDTSEIFVASHQTGLRFNDGKVGRDGSFWVGTMGDSSKPEGKLYRLDQNGKFEVKLENIKIPNGLAWSPDGRIMYFTDSPLRTILKTEDEARTWLVFADTEGPGVPDGATVDSEGCYWSAEYAGSRLVRYAPNGEIDRIIELPALNPTCCAFGGENLDTLFVTTCSLDIPSDKKSLYDGALLALDVGVKGCSEPFFID